MRRDLLLHALRPSLEEDATGAALKEIEHVFYAKIVDVARLIQEAARFEFQEQWNVRMPRTAKNAGNGDLRVRKTIADGKTEYVLNLKTRLADSESDLPNSKLEVAVPTSEDMFKQFMIVSDSGMRKDRYFFPVPNSELVFEVDMFHKPGTDPAAKEYQDWCKIDLEVPSDTTAIPSFPFSFAEMISAPYGKRTDQEESFIRSLYDNVFTIPNEGVRNATNPELN